MNKRKERARRDNRRGTLAIEGCTASLHSKIVTCSKDWRNGANPNKAPLVCSCTRLEGSDEAD